MRRKAAGKRKILPDPKFGNELMAKFINHVMKSGKKSVAQDIVYSALDIALEKLKGGKQEESEGGESNRAGAPSLNSASLLTEVMDRVRPEVEVKSRRVGGATYQVPIEVSGPRGVALAMRWLVEAASGRSEKSMKRKLAAEMVEVMQGRGSALKKRDDTHRMAKANQAFAHYRW